MRDLITRAAAAALAEAYNLVPSWIGGGHARGAEWIAGDLHGGPGESLSVNLRTGKWADFATGDKGGDLVSLRAAILGVRQLDAAKAIAEELRLSDDAPAPVVRALPVGDGLVIDLHPPVACPPWEPLLYHRGLGGAAAAHWIYRWADGSLCCVVARWNQLGKPKEIRTICWSNQGWQMKRSGATGFPVYRLAHVASHQVVVIVEGEKAADAAVRLIGDRAAVVCSIGGASAWKNTDWASLTGKTVLIWPDADAAGATYATNLVKQFPGSMTLPWSWVRSVLPAEFHGPFDAGYDAADLVDDLAVCGIAAGDVAMPAFPSDAPGRATGTTPAGRDVRAGRDLLPVERRVLASLDALGVTADATNGWLRQGSLTRAAVTLSDEDLGRQAWWNAHVAREASEKEDGYYQKVALHVVRVQRETRRAWLLAGMLGTPATTAGREAAARLLRAMVPDADAVDVTVFLHWLWQVKRRAAGLSADRELMPVFVGPQETGKTSTLQRLAAPWRELTIPINVETLTDPRYVFVLGCAIVGIWDEMAGAGRADEAKLKNIVTAEQVGARAMYSNAVQSVAKTCSFIGSANLPVSELINDQTGMRRFYEYRVSTVCDFAVINALDMALVWQAVSEADADPLAGAELSEARRRQDLLRRRDQVAQWIDFEYDTNWIKVAWLPPGATECDVVSAYNHLTGYTLSDLQARFRIWCQRTGVGGFNPAQLRQRLLQEKWTHKKIGPREARGTEKWFRPEALVSSVTLAATLPTPVEPVQHAPGAAAADPRSPADDPLDLF